MAEYTDIADLFPDDHYGLTGIPGLRTYLGEDNPFYEYVKYIRTEMPHGADILGAFQARWRVMLEQVGLNEIADWLMMHVEQRRIRYGPNGPAVHAANPIAYDIWYLYYGGNVLLNSRHPDYAEDEWIEEQIGGQGGITDDNYMYDYFHTTDPSDTLKPLLQPMQDENVDISGGLRGFSSVWGMNPTMVANDSIKDGWRYTIKEARFEVVEWKTKSPYWPMAVGPYDSTTHPPEHLYGPKERASHEPYCGYIAFPVGQLGVMWKISVLTHSTVTESSSGIGPYSTMAQSTSTRPSGTVVHPVDYTTTIEQGGEMLPPFTMATSEVPGELIIDKGWRIADNTMVEFPAEPFEDVDNWKLHYWLRYWIKRDNTEIIPGEFVGLICKPWPLHCWFYQQSSPFVYAGNWVETEFYTSGIVKEVLVAWTDDEEPMPSDGYYDPDEQVSTANGNHYRVWVKGEEMIVESSDWKEYEVGERVGLLKRIRDGSGTNYVSAAGSVAAGPGPGTNFDWQGLKYQKLKGKNTADDDIYTREWVIVPVSFFPDVNSYPNSMS